MIDQIHLRQGAALQATSTRSYDKMNRLESSITTPTAVGERPVGSSYQYSNAGQRKRTTLADGSFWVYEYDWQGRRITKKVVENSATVVDEQFLYDGWNLIAVLSPQSAVLQSFLWGTDLSGSIQGAGGVGGLVKVTHLGPQTTNCFAAFDGNGNVAELVDANDGKVLARYEYGPFGEVLRATGSMATANPFRFSTKYQDDETGLLYYGYRYYDSSTGRWNSRDPIGEWGGVNLYAFVANAAISRVDRDGRKCCCCCAEWLEVENIQRIDDFLDMGNSFQVSVGLYYPRGSGTAGSCKLTWRERSNVPPRSDIPKNEWYNAFAKFPAAKAKKAWDARKEPCGGTETLYLPDEPTITKYPADRTIVRFLDIEITLESTSGCYCASKSITRNISQTLSLINGTPDWNGSTFKVW